MIYQMDTEDILRLVAKYYSVHQILEDGPISSRDLKKRLMEEYHLLKSTARSYINAIDDEEGRIFILYRQEDLARELGKSISTVKSNMNELVEAGLVEKRRADKGRANMIYVKVPAGSLVGMGATDRKATVKEIENKPYKSSKLSSTRVSFQAPNNSNNSGMRFHVGTNIHYQLRRLQDISESESVSFARL